MAHTSMAASSNQQEMERDIDVNEDEPEEEDADTESIEDEPPEETPEERDASMLRLFPPGQPPRLKKDAREFRDPPLAPLVGLSISATTPLSVQVSVLTTPLRLPDNQNVVTLGWTNEANMNPNPTHHGGGFFRFAVINGPDNRMKPGRIGFRGRWCYWRLSPTLPAGGYYQALTRQQMIQLERRLLFNWIYKWIHSGGNSRRKKRTIKDL